MKFNVGKKGSWRKLSYLCFLELDRYDFTMKSLLTMACGFSHILGFERSYYKSTGC